MKRFSDFIKKYNVIKERSHFVFFLLMTFYFKVEAQDLEYKWGISLIGSESKSTLGIVMDSQENVYITGTFEDTLDFDPGPGAAILTPLSINGDISIANIYLAKYDSVGSYMWAKQIKGNRIGDNATSNRIAIDSDENLFITGGFSDSADFDPSSNAAILQSTGVLGDRSIFPDFDTGTPEFS